MDRATEQESYYDGLEDMSVKDILTTINAEDKTVPDIVMHAIPSIENLVHVAVRQMKIGGKIFYIGAGTSGRLGVVDASECPPTFGVPSNLVNGVIAGGDVAIRQAVEYAEDDMDQAWKDLNRMGISDKDILIGIAASGTTPYVIGGLTKANEHGLNTGCIVCNAGSPIAKLAKYPIEVVTGAEFLTGSTRMKAGTAQKLVLNMISTAVMIRLGRVKGNKMINMQLTNKKLVERGIRMFVEETGVSEVIALTYLQQYGNVSEALDNFKSKK